MQKTGLRHRAFRVWESLRTSLWAIPAGLSALALVASRLALWLDRSVDFGETHLDSVLYAGGIEGARTVLSSLASSIITLAGLVFSVTIVALSFASSQLGPRLLHDFRSDRRTQATLGCFVATYLYCFAILSSLRDGEQSSFVPRLSITLALALALLCFGVIVAFIHNVAASIEADNAIESVSSKLRQHIARLRDSDRPTSESAPELAAGSGRASVEAPSSGYIQLVDYTQLDRIARDHDACIVCRRRAGHYVFPGTLLADVATGDPPLDELAEAFVLGANPSDAQDLEYSVRQVVEIALRALSSGINDPYTAIACIDHLAGALAQYSGRNAPAWSSQDGAGRVWYRPFSFAEAMDTAWNQLRQSGARHVAIAIRMLEVYADLAALVPGTEARASIRHHAELIHAAAVAEGPLDSDREALEERLTAVRHSLASGAAASTRSDADAAVRGPATRQRP